VLDHHEPNNAQGNDAVENDKRLQQSESPAFQKLDFDKISEIGKIPAE